MAKARGGKGNGTIKITIIAEILDRVDGEPIPALTAYVFSASGRLLAQENLKGDTVPVQVPRGAEAENLRVLVGPNTDIVDNGELLSTLLRIGAAEAMVSSAEARELYFPIDSAIWPCWLRLCTVRGTLLKQAVSGGVTLDLPVCDAEIEIYEVDPIHLVLPRIPDAIIEKLREALRRPVPPSPPDPGPWIIDPAALPQPRGADAPPPEADEKGPVRLFRFTGGDQRTPGREEITAALADALADERLTRAAEVSGPALRAALPNIDPDLLQRILCFLWPPAVFTRLIATTTTDQCGHFLTRVWRGCHGGELNLYFKAYRRIGPFRFPILAPLPVACHTWWDFECGEEVTLHTTSPFAVTCPPCPPVVAPPHWVLLTAVGNTSVARILGVGQDAPTPAQTGLTDQGQPWAGDLRFRLEFDFTLRTDLNVRYYRVSWREAGSGNPFVALTADQSRHFGHFAGTKFVVDPYVLGPQTVGGTTGLFEMPPALPPSGQWVIQDAVIDTSNATFAASFAPPAGAGLYEFLLELFDGSGALVDGNALGISYRVPTTTDLNTTIDTADAGALGLVTPAGALVFTLHVDNNPCTGSIGATTLGTQTAGTDCGVLGYNAAGETVSAPFTATHPNGFAEYSFRILRGLTQVLGDSGPVGAPPGAHDPTSTVAALLGPCVTAGFAEDLYVSATATDGWNRQSGLDAHPAPRPFVLTPEP